KNEVRDAALIAAAQKVEHYEIASYGTLATLAEQLGYSKALKLHGVVAQQTTESQISDTAVAAYGHFFSQMGEWTLSCVALIVAIV
ncbi:DUF892 family protein, partial [Salmonella enterica subsp. enterica serovar Anatum]|nr:DUF892 family protein [Salmonella enterica subsp. enterica serovar Anatum]